MTTYDATTYNVTSRAMPTGVPGLAVRLGLALENWGRAAARPSDPLAVQRELRRQDEVRAKMMMTERLGRHW